MKRLLCSFGFAILCSTCRSPRQMPRTALRSARASAAPALEAANIRAAAVSASRLSAEQRQLDTQITLAEAEVRAYEDRVREYGPFDRFSTGRPLLFPLQDLRLCMLEARLRAR